MHAGRRQRLIGNSITFYQHEGKGKNSTNTMVPKIGAHTHTRDQHPFPSHPISAQPKPTAPPEPGGGAPLMTPAPVWYHSDIHRNLQNVGS
jgi:hypothetical protein